MAVFLPLKLPTVVAAGVLSIASAVSNPTNPNGAANADEAGAAINLQNALNANSNAYTGQENALQQQYYQNAGNVQQGLINSGLGNTTVAQNMQQAPLQTYNNAMLNLVGQQQGAAANIYGQGAGYANQAALQQAAAASQAQIASMTDPMAQAIADEQKQRAEAPRIMFSGAG